MRLTGLNLSRYGNFEAQRIVFDPAPGRINLLVAPNGAGKSIIRQAFCDLLFGIHGQTPMGFRFGYNGMKLMAEAIGPDRAPFSFGRRKGQGNTLIDADGTPLPGAELARLLGHTDRALLERLFALDTERLRTGGKELLASDGAVADALLSAAGGLRQARQLRLSLEAGRDNQAPARKLAGRPFYLALDRFISSGRQLRNATVKPEAHEKQATELRHLEAEQARLNKVAAHASRRIARLERIRRVVGVLATHDDAAAWLRDHPDAPALPPDTRQDLTAARSALLHAERLLERETGARQALVEQIDAIVVDAGLIGQTEAIEHLIDRAGAARQADRDIPQRQTEHDTATDRIGGLLRQLGLSLPVGRAGEAIPRKADMVRARNLFTEHETSRTTLQRLPPEIAEAARELDATGTILQALPTPRSMPDLLRLTREIRAAGDPDKTAAAASRAVTERQTSLEAALARAPGWTGDAETLIALGVLPRDACQRLDAACAEAERVFDRTTQELERLHRDLAQSRKDLTTVAGETTMPDSVAISAARAHRDSGWRLIYRRAFTAEPALLVQEQEWAGQGPLPLAYQHSVAAADDLADRRNQESDRVAKAAELQRHINETETQIIQAETSRRAAAQAQQDVRVNWQNACAPLSLIAPTLSDVIVLLDARERVIDARRNLTLAQGEQAALQHRHAEWTARLTAALDRNAGTLSALLAFADEIITAAANTETERARLQERLAVQRRLHEGKLAEQRTAGERRDDLHRDWSAVREALARPASEDPATTNALLDLYDELDKEQRSVTELGRRLQQMHDELATFRTEAAVLAQRIAPDLVHADGFDLVAELRRRLTGQRDLAERRKTLTAQLKRADATVVSQRKQHESCVDALRTNLQIIGGATIEAAEARIDAAEQRAARQNARDRAAQELREKGDGRTIDQLRDEVVSVTIDQVEGDIAELGRERDAANAGAQCLAADIATKRGDLNRQARDTEAQAAAADQQSAIATIGHVLDEAALMHLASLLLQASLDTVEAAGTSVLMARISNLFRTITDGAYQRIEAEDPGDGSARLVAVERQFPDERKGVADLSEGSRDQLFLALRLAAIEEHVATAPPLPFLGDDILQTFDDDRAAAAMQALVQLSESVQVILLSHHRHLLALARRLPPDQVHVCELGASLVT